MKSKQRDTCKEKWVLTPLLSKKKYYFYKKQVFNEVNCECIVYFLSILSFTRVILLLFWVEYIRNSDFFETAFFFWSKEKFNTDTRICLAFSSISIEWAP